ncbi:MAG: DUF4345 family protein [Cyclobacteriaceae bacterium]|nr:DUF4345 family protein [Cyclobacteriaceae bacterium]
MNWLSHFLFYTYIGLVLLAGFWGAFINPYFDFRFLIELDPQSLNEHVRANLFSQYRFLRALELGFGLFSIRFVHNIFHEKAFNSLFLVIMGSGILARIVSWIIEGPPNKFHLFFMFYELIGFVIIYLHTRKNLSQHAG